MQPAAIVLMIAGFVFTFFSIPVNLGGLQGFDLLMDPVGWLLVINGLRGLKPGEKAFRIEKLLCLALVVAGAVQLILGSLPAAQYVLQILNMALQILLYLLLSVSLVHSLGSGCAALKMAFRIVFWLNALGALYGLVAVTVGNSLPLLVGDIANILLIAVHLALILLLASLLLGGKNKRPDIRCNAQAEKPDEEKNTGPNKELPSSDGDT